MTYRRITSAFALCLFLVPPSMASDFVSRAEIEKEVQTSIGALASTEARRRLEAAQVLQRWSAYATSAVPALTETLHAEDPNLRIAAAEALEAIGPRAKRAGPALTEALLATHQEMQAAAAFALIAISSPTPGSLAALHQVNDKGSPRLALAVGAARQALHPRNTLLLSERRKRAQDALPLLYRALQEPLGYETWRLARAIAIVDAEVAYSAVGALITAARADDAVVAGNAVRALEAFRPWLKHRGGDLVRAASESSTKTRIEAIRALGWLQINTPAGIAVLRKSLSSDLEIIQLEAAEALGRLGPSAQPSIDELRRLALGSKNQKAREAAALAILRIIPNQYGEFLDELAQRDPKLAERLRQLMALSRL